MGSALAVDPLAYGEGLGGTIVGFALILVVCGAVLLRDWIGRNGRH